ncbi:MAG: nicotinic acid mononucleotide adenylyltransferase, partial [Chloroflexia bacterium]|nr:nicotinic acid mononucleotide adenylyltransferase [Chloroflexia bacterium]
PDKEFSLIMGTDNLVNFHKWKNYEMILKNHYVYVYPRPETTETQFDNHPKIKVVDAPLMEISSSFIRIAVKEKRDVRFFVPQKVWEYIKEMNFYS